MSKQTRLIVGGVALLVVIALILGVFVMGGPDTVSEREFAAKACGLQSEWQENLADTFEESDVLQDIYGGDLSKKDAEAAKTFMVGLFTSSRQYIDRMRTLIDENVVDHEDGEALRDDLLESYDNAIEEFEKAKSDLEDIETDSSAGADELVRFFNDEDEYNTDIDVSSSVEDLASDINERMADLDDNCLDGIADI